MHAETPSADAPATNVKRRSRKWLWIVIVAVIVVPLVFVACLPYLASIGPIRDFLFRVCTPDIHGTVHCGGAQLGWLQPIRFDDIEVRSRDGEPVVSVAKLEGNRTLWQLVWSRTDLGDFDIEKPKLNIVVDEHGTNLSQVFAGRKPDEKPTPESIKPPDVSLGVKLIDASVSVRSVDSKTPWTAEPINFAFRLKPGSASEDGQPRLEVEPGVVFSHTKMTPEICRDLLKYVAPMLSGATDVRGDFSMELDRWEFPMTDFAKGEGAGKFTIHTLDVSPGPIVRELVAVPELSRLLGLRPRLVAVDNEPIEFQMKDGRVYHSRFTFKLERLTIRTSGSVGVDGTLSMDAEIEFPGELLPALAGKKFRIPIRGTLSKPEVDRSAFLMNLGEGVDVIQKMLKSISDKSGENPGQPLRNVIRGLRDIPLGPEDPGKKDEETDADKGKAPGQPPAAPKGPLRNRVGGLIRGALDEALAPPEEEDEQKRKEDPNKKTDEARQRGRALGGLIRGIINEATKEPEKGADQKPAEKP